MILMSKFNDLKKSTLEGLKDLVERLSKADEAKKAKEIKDFSDDHDIKENKDVPKYLEGSKDGMTKKPFASVPYDMAKKEFMAKRALEKAKMEKKEPSMAERKKNPKLNPNPSKRASDPIVEGHTARGEPIHAEKKKPDPLMEKAKMDNLMDKGKKHSARQYRNQQSETGVHNQTGYIHPGLPKTGSSAGMWVRNANKYGKDMKSSKHASYQEAKDQHFKKLQELKHMDAPKLPKSELDKARAEDHPNYHDAEKRLSVRQERHANKPEEKGVHKPIFDKDNGTSGAGAELNIYRHSPDRNWVNKKQSIHQHKKVLSELKSMPKPNLPKSEECMDKDEHQPHLGASRPEHQKIYDAKNQAKQEEHLKSPEGNLERQKQNKERMEKAYVSDAQRKFFHTANARKAGISPSMTQEWDKKSKGEHNLPEHVKKSYAMVKKEFQENNIKKSEDCGMDMEKAKQDEGLSPQRKASARAKRNDRTISLKPKETTLKQYHQFHDKGGAVAGKKGQKIYGKPGKFKLGTHHEKGVNQGGDSNDLKGRSAAGINAEWSKKAKHPEHARQAGMKAKEMHSKKLAELKSMPKPNLPKSSMMKDELKEPAQPKAQKIFRSPNSRPMSLQTKPLQLKGKISASSMNKLHDAGYLPVMKKEDDSHPDKIARMKRFREDYMSTVPEYKPKPKKEEHPSDPNDLLESITGLKNPRNSEYYKKFKNKK